MANSVKSAVFVILTNVISLEVLKEHVGDVLKETNFEGLGSRRIGKVRDIYDGGDKLTLIATDRHSSFDRIIAHVPCKGAILNQISAFWFKQTEDIIPNHVISVPDPNVLVSKKLKPLPIEAVVRGYVTGVTGTSIWTKYQKGEREFGGITLPDGLQKNAKLSEPLFTPTTKSDEHDRPITTKEIVAEGILSAELTERVEKTAKALFARGQEIAAARGLILVDTKYEFGTDEAGNLYLIDEIHTPDSSRYWKAGSYEERFQKGEEPEYFDKEFLRLWFRENCDPYNDPELPPAPVELVVELTRRYIEIYEMITGETFTYDFSVKPEERIKKNLGI